MKKIIGLILTVMMLVTAASAALAESQGTEMYVYTENGKGLTVRSTMNTTDNNFVDSLPYGSKVFAYGSPKPGWTYIEFGGKSGYVMSRFLVKSKPAPHDAGPATNSGSFDTKAAVSVEQINTLVASAKAVTPYSVTVRPTRSSGWVYMRWLPSRNAAQMAVFGANHQLTVIAELKDWYQVQDPETGKVGFIYKSYIQ